MRCVCPATKASAAYPSSIGASRGKPVTGIWKRWSAVHRLSRPPSSARRARRTTSALIAPAASGQLSGMPSFIEVLHPVFVDTVNQLG
jgi:hypothetical protein